jgi:hypothetical protein
VGSPTIRHSNRGHERDANLASLQSGQDVTHAAVVNCLGGAFTSTICAVRKDNRVDTAHSGGKHIWVGQISDRELDLRWPLRRLLATTYQRSNGKPLAERLVYDVPADAASGAYAQERR